MDATATQLAASAEKSKQERVGKRKVSNRLSPRRRTPARRSLTPPKSYSPPAFSSYELEEVETDSEAERPPKHSRVSGCW